MTVLMNRLRAMLAGYLAIRFQGERVERFINLCLQADIPIWDIYTTRNGTVVGKISIDGFKRVRPIARKSGVSVRILRRRGLPFFVNRLWKRTAFTAGAMVFIASLYLMGSIILFVEVKGNEQLTPSRVIQAAAELGIRPGALRSALMSAELSRELVLKLPEISWAGVELKGSHAIIEVVEKKVVKLDPRPVGNLVAQKSGVITKIVATTGKSMVKPGDTVNQGDVLISGAFKVEEELEINYVHAEGIITARVWYEGNGTSSLRRIIRKRTGRTITREVLLLKNREIVLKGPSKIPFALYEADSQSLPLIWRDFGAAVEHNVKTYYELTEQYEQVSFAEAKQEALQLAEQQAKAQVPSGVAVGELVVQAELQADQNTVQVKAVVETTEHIGTFVPLGEPRPKEATDR